MLSLVMHTVQCPAIFAWFENLHSSFLGRLLLATVFRSSMLDLQAAPTQSLQNWAPGRSCGGPEGKKPPTISRSMTDNRPQKHLPLVKRLSATDCKLANIRR